tara:strand:- start:30235 stop:30393 length:159 start_codon:yes stop_codon:yes gene_type:complete
MALADKTQTLLDKFAAWDKRLLKKFQNKFNLSDYQIVWIAFIKGFIIGAIIL